jgi:hypothetical protein
VNRVVWNLRSEIGDPREERAGPQGPPVLPGYYTLRLRAGDATSETGIRVHPDPRDAVPMEVRVQWTEDLRALQRQALVAAELFDEVRAAARELSAEDQSPRAIEIRDLLRETGELRSRLSRLAGSVEAHVGPLTGDEAAQRSFLGAMLDTLRAEWSSLEGG